MTDENAPVHKHLKAAREHLARLQERREAAQAVIAAHIAELAQQPAAQPTAPTTEEPPGGQA